MKAVATLALFLSIGYVLWSCKVRVGENSTVAASESELANQDTVSCTSSTGAFPKITDVSLAPDQAALRFTIEDKAANGSTFKYRYFTHATKYYDPAAEQSAQYYAVRLGDNLLDFAANGNTVAKIYYKPAGNAVELTCK